MLGDLDEAGYRVERERGNAELAALEPRKAEAEHLLAAAEDIARAWPNASLEARRAFVAELCENVVLDGDVLEVVIRPEYREIVAAAAPTSMQGTMDAPDRSGRGRRPKTQDHAVWARRGSNPHALSSTRP